MLQALNSLVAGALLVGVSVLPAQAQPYNWSAWYLGANAGFATADFDWKFAPPSPGDANQAYSLDEGDWFLGLHGGVQWQMGNFVVGVEGAINGGDIVAKERGYGINANFDSEVRLRRMLTIGPRFGWVMDKWLVHIGTGYANAQLSSRAVGRIAPFDSAVGAKTSHDGVYIGVGFDYALTKEWVFGLDYQHVFLGSEKHCHNSGGGAKCSGAAGNFNDRTIEGDIDIIRARLTFMFGGAAPAGPAPLK